MSRNLMLTLAIAALAAAAVASGPASAARHTTISVPGRTSIPHTRRPFHPRPPVHITKLHRHHHWVFRDGRWIVLEEPVVGTVVPSPCTCLTKNYTPDGLVVFADLCTKESASAPADGSVAQAEGTANPDDYAGRTYQDYLAAHPQTAETQKLPAVQAPNTPQKN